MIWGIGRHESLHFSMANRWWRLRFESEETRPKGTSKVHDVLAQNTQAHTHVPWKSNESQRSDDVSSSTRRRSFGFSVFDSSTPLWRYTEKKDSLGILLKSGTEYFTRYAISSGTRRQTRANLSKPVAPRRATVAGVLCFVRRDVRNRVTRRRDVRRTSGSVSTRRANETWRGINRRCSSAVIIRTTAEIVERRRK